MQPPTTIFIVDDDEACRDSVKELLRSVGHATETFASAIDFLEAFDPRRPGCLLLDVRMARMSGIALQQRLGAIGARIPIVFMSGHGDIAMAVKAVKDGAVDFVQKPFREQELLEAVDEALQRAAELPKPSVRTSARGARAPVVEAGDPDAALDAGTESLSAREREVMLLALRGLSSKLIARELSISPRTVEQHRRRLLEKTGVRSIAELQRLRAGRSSA